MGSAPPLFSAALIVLRRLLQRILGSKLVRGAVIGYLQRVALWVSSLRSKLYNRKTRDKPPKDRGGLPKDGTFSQQDPSYAVVRNGDIISLNGVVHSLYPYSANGIRNTSRTSVRATQQESRNASRSSQYPDSDYAHSDRASFYELERNPSRPYRPPSQISRVPSRLRNPRRQLSTSLPDLSDPMRAQPLPHSESSWFSRIQSPAPEVDIELASPVDTFPPENTGGTDDSHPYAPFRQHNRRPTITEQRRDTASTSPPPDIAIEVASPIAALSPKNYSDTSLKVPSVSSSGNHYSESVHSSVHTDSEQPPPDSNSDNETHVIKPVVPEDTKRYKRRTKILKKFSGLDIDPVTTTFDRPSSPSGWRRLVHPEGARYFYHPEKRAYTESDLYDPRIYEWLMNDISRLESLVETFETPMPQDALLMIDVNYDPEHKDNSILQTEYYYVDHSEKAIFWVHHVDALDFGTTWEIYGAKTHRHFGFEIRAQYWYFISLYPDSLALTAEMVCELRDIVLHLLGDTMTSPYSTAPYTMDVLFQILTLTESMEKNIGPNWVGAMSLLARHMYIFCHSHFLNFYGESYARVERDFSVFGDPLNKRTWLVKSLSFILFSAPEVHLRNLQKMWVDGLMHKSVWAETTKKLNDEWQEFVFFATVMLTSNVGYLAIQSVDINDGPRRTAGQIASYLSVVANIGSIILGLLLMRQNRTKMRETAEDVQNFLLARNHPMLGLETLAILYSLPYALLMWGIVAFLVAFCCIFFDHSTSQSRGLVGSLSIAVAILIVWCVATSWEKKGDDEEPDRPLAYEDTISTENKDEKSLRGSASTPQQPAKQRILDIIIRSIPNYMYGRKSVDSQKTAVV